MMQPYALWCPTAVLYDPKRSCRSWEFYQVPADAALWYVRAGGESCHSRRETLLVWPCFLSCLWLLRRQCRVIRGNALGTPEIKESPRGKYKEKIARVGKAVFSYWSFLWSQHAVGQTDWVQHSGNQTIRSRYFTFLCDLCQKLNTKKVCFFLDLVYWFKLLETQKKLRPGSFHSLSLAKGL